MTSPGKGAFPFSSISLPFGDAFLIASYIFVGWIVGMTYKYRPPLFATSCSQNQSEPDKYDHEEETAYRIAVNF